MEQHPRVESTRRARGASFVLALALGSAWAAIGVPMIIRAQGTAAPAPTQQQPADQPVLSPPPQLMPPSPTGPTAPAVQTSQQPAASVPHDGSAIADAERIGYAFAAVAQQVSPSVVSIRVEARIERPTISMPFGIFGPGEGEREDFVRGGGSGFVISEDGAIVTNRHVVEHATRISVRLQDGRELPGTVVGIDRPTDLAVIRVPARNLRPLRFADLDQQHVGQWVVAIGSPFGLDMTVTAGVLSATGRGGLGVNEIEDYVQTDASINPGNSGGPLVNLAGEVVGVNAMIVGRAQGIGFAIPADIAQTVTEQLLQNGRVRRAWLGVGFQELTPELAAQFGLRDRHGALINEIVPNGPAARAGLENGDVVVAVDGQPVNEMRDLMRTVLRRPIGAPVRLDVVRNRRARTVTLTTGERPDAREEEEMEAQPSEPMRDEGGFGVQMIPLTPAIAEQLGFEGDSGAVVARVRDGSPADRAGLERGDVIVEADRHAVRTPDDVVRELGDGHAVLRAQRGERAFYTVLERE